MAGRLPGWFDGLSKRLRYPFRPPWIIITAVLATIACTSMAGKSIGIPPNIDEITKCPTENCRVLHHPRDAATAQRVAVQLNQAVYVATTIMEEPPSTEGATLVLDPEHTGAIAEFNGITGRSLKILAGAAHDQRLNYVSMNPTATAQLENTQLLRIMLHEVGHYWWRVDGQRGNWLNEWGAIGMEVTSGAHDPPAEPPQCTANWSPKNDPGLHDETGRCVRRIGEHALRTARQAYLKQHGLAGEELMRRTYRSLYGLAIHNPGLTPTDVGQHFAEQVLERADARSVLDSFSRLQ